MLITAIAIGVLVAIYQGKVREVVRAIVDAMIPRLPED